MFLLRAISSLTQTAPPSGLAEHLEALRRTLIAMAAVLLVTCLLCFCLAPQLMELLRRPAEQVWLRHESAHLPGGVSAADWQLAKRLAALRPALSPAARAATEQALPPAVPALANAVPPLQAAALLPESARRTSLAAAVRPEQSELVLSLYDAGAELQTGPAAGAPQLMGVFRPAEGFLIAVNMSFFAGLLLALPALLFLLMRFIRPGLHPRERALLRRAVVGGTLLFLGGAAFAYAAVLPRVLAFFFDYARELGIQNDWRIGYYLGFAVKLVLLFGLVFELPVLLLPLIRLHVLTYELMRRTRGYAFILCLALALLLAPAPDPGTMLLLALPLYALYELCILFAHREQGANDTPR